MGVADSSSGCIGSDVYDWRDIIMIYSKGTPGNGEWHCPFEREWLERMKQAAKHCENVTEAMVEATLNHVSIGYVLPKGDFLSEPQDARGLPLSWCIEERRRFRNWPDSCVSIYDYDTIPELVVTNGNEDWDFNSHYRVLTA